MPKSLHQLLFINISGLQNFQLNLIYSYFSFAQIQSQSITDCTTQIAPRCNKNSKRSLNICDHKEFGERFKV